MAFSREYHSSARLDRGSSQARPETKSCAYEVTGRFCSHACTKCDSRMLSRAESARQRARARQTIETARLMRAPEGTQ